MNRGNSSPCITIHAVIIAVERPFGPVIEARISYFLPCSVSSVGRASAVSNFLNPGAASGVSRRFVEAVPQTGGMASGFRRSGLEAAIGACNAQYRPIAQDRMVDGDDACGSGYFFVVFIRFVQRLEPHLPVPRKFDV